MYLKTVDKFNELSVNCLVTPSNAKLLILHESSLNKDNEIKQFLNEVYDLFAKLAMNPFFSQTEKINIDEFKNRVNTYS